MKTLRDYFGNAHSASYPKNLDLNSELGDNESMEGKIMHYNDGDDTHGLTLGNHLFQSIEFVPISQSQATLSQTTRPTPSSTTGKEDELPTREEHSTESSHDHRSYSLPTYEKRPIHHSTSSESSYVDGYTRYLDSGSERSRDYNNHNLRNNYGPPPTPSSLRYESHRPNTHHQIDRSHRDRPHIPHSRSPSPKIRNSERHEDEPSPKRLRTDEGEPTVDLDRTISLEKAVAPRSRDPSPQRSQALPVQQNYSVVKKEGKAEADKLEDPILETLTKVIESHNRLKALQVQLKNAESELEEAQISLNGLLEDATPATIALVKFILARDSVDHTVHIPPTSVVNHINRNENNNNHTNKYEVPKHEKKVESKHDKNKDLQAKKKQPKEKKEHEKKNTKKLKEEKESESDSSDSSSSDSDSESEEEEKGKSEVNEKPTTKANKNSSVSRSCIASSQQAECLLQFRSTYVPAHGKKCRSLVINPVHRDMIATSSLDGSVKFWSFENGKISNKGTMDRSMLRINTFPNAIAWNNKGTHCAIAPVKETMNDYKKQLVIVRTDSLPKARTHFIEASGHDKDITAICYVPRTDDKVLSVSQDHKLVMWTVKEKSSAKMLHEEHTAAVLSVCGHPEGDIVYTGGADKRLIAWSLESQKLLWVKKFEDKINSLKFNPKNSDLLLMCKTTNWGQLGLMDLRVGKSVRMWEWRRQNIDSGPSQHIEPSWSPEGFLISCGSTDPIVNIWDIRYSKTHLPVQSFHVHDKRILAASFLHTNSHMVTISSDRRLGIHSFSRKYSDSIPLANV